jgi:hypothetical protein
MAGVMTDCSTAEVALLRVFSPDFPHHRGLQTALSAIGPGHLIIGKNIFRALKCAANYLPENYKFGEIFLNG